MDYFDILLARKLANKGDITTESLSVTENGTYTAPSGKAYTPVTVEVEPPENSYQLKSITTPTSLATFTASAMPMPTLKVSVEANQDLHGYDHPWVGGAGKNKIDASDATLSGDGYFINKVIDRLPSGDYILSFDCTVSGNAQCQFDIKDATTIVGTKTVSINSGTSRVTMKITASSSFNVAVAYITKASTIQHIQLEQGSTATSFEPYSNICPITGWDAAKVRNHGENLFDTTESTEDKYVDVNGELVSYPGWYASTYIAVTPNTEMTFNPNSSAGAVAKHAFYNGNKEFISAIDSGEQTFTTPSNCRYMRFSYRNDSSDVQLKLVSTTTITLPQTVYGGEVDVVNGMSGNKLTYGIIDLSSRTWTAHQTPGRFYFHATSDDNMKGFAVNVSATGDCSNYKVISQDQLSVGNVGISIDNSVAPYVNIYDPNCVGMSAFDFKTYLNGAQLKYELATPTTFVTQPTPIKSLNGLNNLSVDSGDVIEGEYFKALGGDDNA